MLFSLFFLGFMLAWTLVLTSSSDSDASSSSSPSTPLTEFELDILDLDILCLGLLNLDIVSFSCAKPFDTPGSSIEFFCEDELRFPTFVNSMLPASASSCIFGDKMEVAVEEDENVIVLPQVKTVAWWTV